jgi:uncharacterized SAM-binding protein YcdF (DUF218 family)
MKCIPQFHEDTFKSGWRYILGILKKMRRPNIYFSLSKRKLLVCFLAVAAILLYAFRGLWLGGIGNFLIIRDNLHPADVIHVIAGEDYRTDYAVQLYKRGYGKILFFTGGWCESHHHYHGEYARERAVAKGIPGQAIAYDDSSVTSTYLEAEKLKDWIAFSETPVSSVIVVSDPFHMRRARWAYKKVLGDNIEVEMAPVPFNQTPYRRRWWKDRESLNYVRDEYKKMVYYIFRYQISRGKFKDWLASLDRE